MISRLFAEFKAAVRLQEVRVKRPTQIFLCGGDILTSDVLASPKSARHAFCNYLRKTTAPLLADIVLAEVIVEDREQDEHGFKDLLELERLVAEIVGVVLLFVESPGSYAELGAFTENPTILRRLVVVIDNSFRENTRSFIYRGPLKRLINQYEQSLRYETWLSDEGDPPVIDEQLAETMAAGLAQSLPAYQKRNGDTALLSAARGDPEPNEGEMMCLITGLLDVFLTLGLAEIEEILLLFATPSSGQKISRYLYVLRRLKLVDRVLYSNKWWYFSSRSLVEWSFLEGSPQKTTLDWRRHIRDEYTRAKTSEPGTAKRLGALTLIFQQGTGVQDHE